MKGAEIVTREFVPALWPALEKLFGANGACGGCWCMFWRLEETERYEDVKGPSAKRRLKALARAGKLHGVLAFHGDEPAMPEAGSASSSDVVMPIRHRPAAMLETTVGVFLGATGRLYDTIE
jgi:hypothetical protein